MKSGRPHLPHVQARSAATPDEYEQHVIASSMAPNEAIPGP
jgi:hypothetical protein